MHTLVEFRNISKKFPGVQALDNVTVDLRKGEVHVLVGENGAGKSTLMKILSGAYAADSGELHIDGSRVIDNTPTKAMELGVGMIYQELNLIPELSVMQNLFLGNEIKKGLFNDNRAMMREVRKYLDALHIDIHPRTLVKNLSVATQQMVEIAKALSKNSKVLVLDEPTSSLTDSEMRELFRRIALLKEKGVGMFYISHRLEELYEIGDRVTIMRDGQVIGTHAITDLSMESMIEQIAGRTISALFPHSKKRPGDRVLEVDRCGGERFSNVSLHVDAGEIVGLAGLVGAGRTELARAIFGIDDYDEGSITLKGRPVSSGNPPKAAAMGIGLLPEDRKVQGLALLKSIRENIVVTSLGKLGPMGITDVKKEKSVCERFVGQLSIATPTVEKQAGFLSGGTQQKVVIAKWLLADLELFIFDEPTRGIDVGAKAEIYRLMDDLVGRGAAILMISSDLPEILGMSDRIYVMANGKITGELTSEQADQNTILALAYNQAAAISKRRLAE